MNWPTLFLCRSCHLPTALPVCGPCRERIRLNADAFDLGREGIESCFPLLLSLGTTQAIIRSWKEKRGNALRSLLFQMHSDLREQLIQLGFTAIIPIPQDPGRSRDRGHASALEVARFFAQEIRVPLLELLALEEGNPTRMTGKSRFERDYEPNPFRISERLTAPDPLLRILEEQVMRQQEIRFLLVDDLITSGATLSKASQTLHRLLPRARIWAGGLGFRPGIRPEPTRPLEPPSLDP